MASIDIIGIRSNEDPQRYGLSKTGRQSHRMYALAQYLMIIHPVVFSVPSLDCYFALAGLSRLTVHL